ncbi:transcriptional regulator [Candidatus Bathyarchaeota archaeon]|nr:transcriptional regulator [Candidatus Bathyarchaeota archaeon]MBL7167630.1 transcriptional regulator [Candidatus Bathyarchaeota archaeon]
MKRNNLDICADILRVSRGGAKKTHLVYKANLNFNIVKKYITGLTESGLLEKNGERFYVTEEGKLFIDRYDKLSSPFHVI